MTKRLVITGYKPFELGIFSEDHEGIPIIKRAIRDRLIEKIDEGLEWVIVSGQLGVEAWACDVVRELQETYPSLHYAVLLPFRGQEERWNEANQMKFEEMVALADYSVFISDKPYEAPWQFQAADDFMLRNSDSMLIVYDEENEGSPKFRKRKAERYAANHPYEVELITAHDLQWIAEELQMEKWEDVPFDSFDEPPST